jgi:DNA-binding XRE family transcriptional regulator
LSGVRTRFVLPYGLSGGWFATLTTKGFDMAENKRLRAARALAGLTQLQLAARIGRKEIEVSRFETGRAQPDSEVKRRIAEVLGKPTFEIFDV